MNKRVAKAFGKKIFLLGRNKYGENVWLEEARWRCDWYWGFGYLETYTNNNHPEKSRDISSHSHFSGIWENDEHGKYVYHINDCMEETVLSDKEAWELSDLMKRFYAFKKVAEIYHHGNANYTSTTRLDNKDLEAEKHINNTILPQIFNAIYEILSP